MGPSDTDAGRRDGGQARRRAQLSASVRSDEVPGVRGTGPFDAIARLAAATCGAPIAGVAFLEEDHLRLVSAVGVPETVTALDLDVAPCGEVVRCASVRVVEDLRDRPSYRETPLVVASGVRAYAGAPVRDEGGAVIGAVFVLDRTPRRVPDDQLRCLEDLAGQASGMVAAARSRRLLERSLSDAEARRELLDLQQQVLRHAADGADLGSTLGPLLGGLGRLVPGHRATIVLDDGARFGDPVVEEACWTLPIEGAARTLGSFVVHGPGGAASDEQVGSVAELVELVAVVVEQHRARQELQTARDLLEGLADAAGDWVWRKELLPVERYVYVNDSLVAGSGVARERWLADPHTIAKHLHPDDAELVRISRAKGDPTWPREVRWRRPDGAWRWVSARQQPIRDDAGRIVAIQGLAVDITAQKELAKRVAATADHERGVADRLRELDRATSALVSAVSHQIRTPLTMLLGAAETLSARWRTLDQDACDQLLSRLLANANDFHRQLGDLLDLDRLLHRSSGPTTTATLDLAELVRAAVSSSVLGDRVASLRCSLGTARVTADGPTLGRALTRLFEHLVETTPRHARLSLEVAATDGGAELVIADDAAGALRLSANPLEDLDPDDPDPRVRLGPPLVVATVHRAGGRVVVEEGSGGAAVLRLWLPGPATTPVPARAPAAASTDSSVS